MRLKETLTIFRSKFIKVNPQRNRNIVVPAACDLSKQNLSHIIPQSIGHVSITRPKLMTRKGLMKGPPINIPDSE